jgi:hypothetical protein
VVILEQSTVVIKMVASATISNPNRRSRNRLKLVDSSRSKLDVVAGKKIKITGIGVRIARLLKVSRGDIY